MSRIKRCIYNMYVECEHKNTCSRCGWSPEVEQVRKKEIFKRRVTKGECK